MFAVGLPASVLVLSTSERDLRCHSNLFGVPREASAVVLTVLVAIVTIGGIQSIAKVAGKVVPAMALFYIVASLSVIVTNADKLADAVKLVLVSAFTSTAATGGFLGASIMLAIQSHIARGVFSNESGLGSAPMAAAAAKLTRALNKVLSL